MKAIMPLQEDRKNLLSRIVAAGLLCLPLVAAQPVDDTQLKQVIIFGRHSVRSPVAPTTVLNNYSAQPFPEFSVPPGYLTSNGATLETILGGYYRLWLTKQGLLSGNDKADAAFVYFRSNVIERTIASAQAFAAGMLPAGTVSVDYYGPTQSDPLFDPVGAGVARFDQKTAIAAIQGRFGGDMQSLATAYAPELALARSVLFGYPTGQTPVPATPNGKIDVTTIPFQAIAGGKSGWPVDPGGLGSVLLAVDPFVMEYAEGLPASEVGWGRLNTAGLSQILRLYSLGLDVECHTPYMASVQSSNLASHVVRSMLQAATGNAMTGTLGKPSTKEIVLIASDAQIVGLAGLFHLDWVLPGYQADYCAPGGALVFELRQSQSTGEYIVRASYVAQTLDQLRNRTALTLNTPPASAPVFIPGCSTRNATFDCALADFVGMAKHAIDAKSADLVN
jgi:4-phytase/acid phosphatase